MYFKKLFYFYQKVENNTEFNWNNGRPYWVLDYFNDAMHVLNTDGNVIDMQENAIFITPPHTPSAFKSVSGKPFTHSTIIFEPDEKYLESLKLPYMSPIYIEDKNELERLLFDMESKQLSNSAFKQHEQDAYIWLIMLHIYDCINSVESDYSCNSGDDLQKVKHTVMNSPGVFLTTEQMAARANMSVRSFQRKYKELYGSTPIADLYKLRFENSKRLMDTGYSINHILNSCGFKSPEHFSRFFKKHAGITPSEYIKQHSDQQKN